MGRGLCNRADSARDQRRIVHKNAHLMLLPNIVAVEDAVAVTLVRRTVQ